MLSVEQAQREVLSRARRLPAETRPLGPELLGLTLAEDIASDLDLPPFDKSMMDGYAIAEADLGGPAMPLQVIEEVPAGKVPTKSVSAGQATRIMTGAMVPEGTAAVVMLERCELLPGERVRIFEAPLRRGQNILPRGQEMRAGDVVLRAGAVIRPQEVGLLASVGRAAVSVFRRPRLAVLSTGDELVEPDQRPGPGQIRNSNAPLLCAQAVRAGALPTYLGVARDRLDSLGPLIAAGLKHDVLVLSGGVSAGKLDLVPQLLNEAGVQTAFHKVQMKPGKPLFFGTRENTLVFGLPGNPVSALVGFELFVRPAVRALLGWPAPHFRTILARLARDFRHKSDRPIYHPARLSFEEEACMVEPVPWFGSPDLRSISQANAFLILPVGDRTYPAGELLEVLATEWDS